MNANEYKAMAAAYLAALPAAGKSPCTVMAYRNAADGFGAYLDGSGEDVSPLAVIGWRSALAAVVGNNTTAHSMTMPAVIRVSAKALVMTSAKGIAVSSTDSRKPMT